MPYAQLERDSALVAELIDGRIRRMLGSSGPGRAGHVAVGVLPEQGRLPRRADQGGDETIPLVLPLLHAERGIVVDAVLMTSDEASVVFGFSWTYFRVDCPRPRALVDFLGSIMPLKLVNELYTSIGYNKHGKTELYRGLMRHLEEPEARFAFAEGDEGMVMAVFTLPSFNVVFKIIKDSFGAPKNTTRRAVMEKYHFVFVRDRVGRLADAQEFEHLEFPRRCFPDELLGYLLGVAGETVRVEGDQVIVRHLYTERRVTPLNLFLRDADEAAARETVIDYGNAIKDLAAADIFTGDMLAQELRGDPERPGDLLRLRRAVSLEGVPLSADPCGRLNRGRIRGGALVLRRRAGRVPGRVQGISGAARQPARGLSRESRRSAGCRFLAGGAATGGWGRGGGRVSLSQGSAAAAVVSPRIGLGRPPAIWILRV